MKKTNARELAKLGLTTTLGVLVVTGFSSRSATARKLHVLAGGALLGLSLWHSMLYQPKKRSPKKEGENK
ncbi:MAG: hypothetical protein CSB33_00865 [Desulfobacterales bacterium]|nr:MAG: hypothetical protein CSB33_00865 [Desulfobacterales bacterium]